MSDKLQANVGPFFALHDWHVVELEGRDAATFSQAQFINDVAALGDGQWHWSGWLTPKGRVVALFALLKWSAERITLLVPDADAGALAASLGRFVFRSKVKVRQRGDLAVTGSFSVSSDATHNRFVADDEGGVELDLGTAAAARCIRVTTKGAAEDAGQAARWTLFDVAHGLPRLPPEQLERWTPQQLSLERLDGFSVKKGCYPGQEIVARTHFLGKAKRGLVLLEADAAFEAGSDVRAGDAVVGTVVSAAAAGGRHVALAVMSLEREAAALDAGGVPARETPLMDGLAR